MEQKKGRKFIKRLKVKYRLVIMTENTFEEKFSFSLTPMNVFIAVSTSIVILSAIVISLIAFTPVREYIPGYSYSKQTRRDLDHLIQETSRLEKEVRERDRYIQMMKEIINGHTVPADSLRNLSDSAMGQIDQLIEGKLQALSNKEYLSEEESQNKGKLNNYTFFTPLRGFITDRYDLGKDHLAVDIVSKPNEAVKAALDGTVIFASWTPETGHVIGLQHSNNLVSIYKHNSVLLKKTGSIVNAGDAIAIVGNSGELTSGPHLHFELWHNGNALNPEEFMAF
jgi:murein DD-endopeptidase MepM/ murein hydrolase activator NlpD